MRKVESHALQPSEILPRPNVALYQSPEKQNRLTNTRRIAFVKQDISLVVLNECSDQAKGAYGASELHFSQEP